MNTALKNATDAETGIRALIDSWLQAVKSQDVGRIMSHYADDVVAYDAILQLQFKGADAYGKHWQFCMEQCSGPTVFELHGTTVAADGDVAFTHALCRCGGTDDQGNEQTGWTRMTACYRKLDGRWKIAHEHFSAPFDMENGKALLELQP